MPDLVVSLAPAARPLAEFFLGRGDQLLDEGVGLRERQVGRVLDVAAGEVRVGCCEVAGVLGVGRAEAFGRVGVVVRRAVVLVVGRILVVGCLNGRVVLDGVGSVRVRRCGGAVGNDGAGGRVLARSVVDGCGADGLVRGAGHGCVSGSDGGCVGVHLVEAVEHGFVGGRLGGWGRVLKKVGVDVHGCGSCVAGLVGGWLAHACFSWG